jgi:hypothetical protein
LDAVNDLQSDGTNSRNPTGHYPFYPFCQWKFHLDCHLPPSDEANMVQAANNLPSQA